MATSAPSPDDPLGFDVLVADDIGADGRTGTGAELAKWAIYHRLTTEKLYLIGAPGNLVDFGVDVRRWVGAAMTPASAAAKGPQVEIVVRRDPRISTVRAAVTLAGPSLAKYAMRIVVDATLVSGQTISLVLGVSAVTVDLLSLGT